MSMSGELGSTKKDAEFEPPTAASVNGDDLQFNEGNVPAIHNHARKVYAAMRERATAKMVSGESHQVYEGFLTHMFAEIGVPTPYYTQIMRLLIQAGCVAQLRRGGGGAASIWAVFDEPPDEETLSHMTQKSQSVYGRPATKATIMEQHIKDLSNRIMQLEDDVAFLLRDREEGT